MKLYLAPLAALLSITAQLGSASAEPDLITPAYLSLDGHDEGNGFRFDEALVVPGASNIANLTTARAHLHIGAGFQVFGVVGVTSLIAADDASDEPSGLHNLELGSYRQFHLGDNFSLATRASITLPTASRDGDGFTANAIGSLARINDAALVAPETAMGRLALSPRFRSGMLEVRGDLGADVAFEGGMLLRGGLAVAARGKRISLAAEVAGVTSGQDSLATAGLSMTAAINKVRPMVAVSTPISSDIAGEALIMSAGLSGSFR